MPFHLCPLRIDVCWLACSPSFPFVLLAKHFAVCPLAVCTISLLSLHQDPSLLTVGIRFTGKESSCHFVSAFVLLKRFAFTIVQVPLSGHVQSNAASSCSAPHTSARHSGTCSGGASGAVVVLERSVMLATLPMVMAVHHPPAELKVMRPTNSMAHSSFL